MSNIAVFSFADLACALLCDFVNADDRVHGHIAAGDIGKFRLQLLFTGVYNQFRLLTKNQLFNLYEAVKIALVDLSGINFEDLALIVKNDLKNGLVRHRV